MSDESRSPESFGPNVWLIDEMFREFKEHPESVSESWREFFSDYRPAVGRMAPPPVATGAPAAVAPTQELAPRPATVPIVGPARRLVENMQASLTVPTATSVRTIPVRLLDENRWLMNQHLAELSGGKVSYTHLLAWALVTALDEMPGMRSIFVEVEGAPHRRTAEHVNFGVAVDIERRDGSRGLVVPSIKHAETLEFATFFAAYNELIRRAQAGHLVPEDFADTTVSLTNPGMLGTTQSVPRLMAGQSLIVAAGAIGYPAEYQLADPAALARLGVSKVLTLTCTYDHRVIQGAESAEFLGRVAALLAGEGRFYDQVFTSLAVPHEPVRLAPDSNPYFSDRGVDALVRKQAGVFGLVNMYRVRGHLVAHINPLSTEIPTHPELDLEHHGLTVWDLDREFYSGGVGGRERAGLREIVRILREAYCGTLGVEYMFIQEPDQKAWIQQRVEGADPAAWLDAPAKRRALAMLNAAEAFERFLHTKYIGHKRFSLEGLEALIPMLDRVLAGAVQTGIAEVVLGMAHRGRLNVLANILGKSYEKIFREFEGNIDPLSREGTGDVKYHLGATGTYTGPGGGQLHITMASNPSHLEAVDPVVEGMARALQDVRGDATHEQVLPVLVHGDAAFAGQGVVAETLNMSALSGYRTGGTVHIVVNNGIGFTTSPADARSSVYATDVAKMVQAPVFHVNGEDPEACVHVMDLALEFRREFAKDVVVDVVGYRRWGHNEADEPAYTQPIMYAKIHGRRSVRKLYTERLVNHGDLTLAEAEAALKDFQDRLEAAFAATHESAPPSGNPAPVATAAASEPPPPPVPLAVLREIAVRATSVPDGFHVHPKLARQLEQRRRMLDEGGVDWGTAEMLAFGSLLRERIPVRLSGQDSRRGTFSQRHAVLVDQDTGAEYTPLQHLEVGQAPFLVYDSLLSEYAVLGFEYGYSVMRPDALVLWEAQFGDFADGAQIIIDSFIAAAEDKWGQRSKLVLLLPHGAEGQGPEHSSARLERFLQLTAGDHLRVAAPSTAAQYYHLLRAQAHAGRAAPLVVMTPKSLLRAEAAKSRAGDFSGAFEPVLADPEPPEAPERALLCSGKVAFELLQHRRAQGGGAAVVRIERLSPFPAEEIRTLLDTLPTVRELRWVQEEPANMGAWGFVAPRLAALAPGLPLAYVGRPESSSPATGSHRVFLAEQERVVQGAFAP